MPIPPSQCQSMAPSITLFMSALFFCQWHYYKRLFVEQHCLCFITFNTFSKKSWSRWLDRTSCHITFPKILLLRLHKGPFVHQLTINHSCAICVEEIAETGLIKVAVWVCPLKPDDIYSPVPLKISRNSKTSLGFFLTKIRNKYTWLEGLKYQCRLNELKDCNFKMHC